MRTNTLSTIIHTRSEIELAWQVCQFWRVHHLDLKIVSPPLAAPFIPYSYIVVHIVYTVNGVRWHRWIEHLPISRIQRNKITICTASLSSPFYFHSRFWLRMRSHVLTFDVAAINFQLFVMCVSDALDAYWRFLNLRMPVFCWIIINVSITFINIWRILFTREIAYNSSAALSKHTPHSRSTHINGTKIGAGEMARRTR